MFGSIGGGEILMILALALLLFGPRRLPQIGKTIGKTLSEFRKATHDLKSSLEHEVAREDLDDLKAIKNEVQSAGQDIAAAVTPVNPLGIARGALDLDSAPTESKPQPLTDASTPVDPTAAAASESGGTPAPETTSEAQPRAAKPDVDATD